jgi:error-prone DNA polymerase
MERLAAADAFARLNQGRRAAIWDAFAARGKLHQRMLFDDQDPDEPEARLPESTPQEEVQADYKMIGLSLRSHPMAFQREQLKPLGVIPTAALGQTPSNTFVKVAGIVLMRQRPSTSKGITFVTIEDETGAANLIVYAAVWERFRQIASHSQAWIVHGRVENQKDIIHVIVKRMEDLTARLPSLVLKSRDFR